MQAGRRRFMIETLSGWELVRRIERQEARQEVREEVRQEVREEVREEVAVNLLQDGMDSEKVVEVTNLSRRRVESLWQKMNGGSKP